VTGNPYESLRPLGWTQAYSLELLALEGRPAKAGEEWLPARVVGEERGFYRLLFDAAAPEVLAEISGKMRYEAIDRRHFPAVGDWVAARPVPPDRAVIHALLPRRTIIARKEAGEGVGEQILATNVDTAFIVTSANQDLNVRRIERYLALISESGAKPAVLLTKVDLVPDADSIAVEIASLAPEVPVHPVSPKTGKGLSALSMYFREGQTAVLLGSSGVGKSTLTNRLLGQEKLKTAEVREHDDRGRHTTTSRYLLVLPGGGMIIDTPGLRELQLTSEQTEAIQASFHEIEDLMRHCKFSNCGHSSEPGCALRAALADGSLSEERWQSYLKLEAEAQARARKTDKASASEHKGKWKNLQKGLRARLKEKGKK
jgi:ribosome biogenesis GTPase / thiamine phosphate phosphatase